MEANLQFYYTTPAGQNKHLTALLACSCPDDSAKAGPCSSSSVEVSLAEDCKQIPDGEIRTGRCKISTSNLENCISAIEAADWTTTPTATGQISFDSECDAVKDRGTFYQINVGYNLEQELFVTIGGTDQLFKDTTPKEKLYTCKKRKLRKNNITHYCITV